MALMAWLLVPKEEVPAFEGKASLDFGIAKRLPAWSVFLTMSMQSLSLYSVIAWLPAILQTGGFSLADAGRCTALFVLVSVPASLLTAQSIRWCCGARRLSVAMTVSFILGVFCWWLGGAWAYVGSILAGIPQGNRLTLAMVLISEKSHTLPQMLSLSALTQFAGYLIAGCGPFLCGLLYFGDGNWVPVLSFIAVSGIVWGMAAVYGFGPCQVFPSMETSPGTR